MGKQIFANIRLELIVLCFSLVISAVICTLLVASALCDDKSPMRCQILVNRMAGFTFCMFSQVNSTDHDVSTVEAMTLNYQGRDIESETVTAISIAFSNFDEFPSAIFDENVFGNISRVQFYGGSLKRLSKTSFKDASGLRFVNMWNSTINEISSDVFKGATQLEELTFENCAIGKVAKDAFSGANNLKQLKLVGSTYPNTKFLLNLPDTVKVIRT